MFAMIISMTSCNHSPSQREMNALQRAADERKFAVAGGDLGCKSTMRAWCHMTLLAVILTSFGCSEEGDSSDAPMVQSRTSEVPLEVAADIPAWVSNGVFCLKWYHLDASGFAANGSEYSLTHPHGTTSIGGSAGNYCLKNRWLAARTNGFEFLLVAEFREGADWVSHTNTILFPYKKGGMTNTLVTNTFGVWSVAGEFK